MSNSSESGSPRCSSIGAALLLSVAYAMVHLDQFMGAIRSLTGGAVQPALSRTRTMSFGEGDRQTTLEAYWSNNRLHYRVRHQITPEQLASSLATARSKPTPVVLEIRLQNRFGADLLHIQVSASEFSRDKEDEGSIVARGSTMLSESAYREAVESWKGRSRHWFVE